MRFRRNRRIEPEILDDQTPGRAAPSLRDIVRINRITGGHEVLRKCLRGLLQPDEAFSFLDIGAGSGDAAAVVKHGYPKASVISLDYRLHHVRNASSEKIVGDAFHLPVRPRAADVVYCALFLHHFPDDQVVALLAGMREAARRFVIVNDLERHVLPWLFLPATRWLFRWDPITLHDGPISVQAGFTGPELRSLALRAGLGNVRVRVHRPAFRVSLVASASRSSL
jgi:SAM-dependent methyltransferase